VAASDEMEAAPELAVDGNAACTSRNDGRGCQDLRRHEHSRLATGQAPAIREMPERSHLLADGFIYTEDDRTVGRDDVLRDVVAGPDTVETAHNEDMKVHRFGTTAIVTGWLVVGGHGSQGPFSRRYRFTDTWVRRDGRWQIVAAHDYLVPAR